MFKQLGKKTSPLEVVMNLHLNMHLTNHELVRLLEKHPNSTTSTGLLVR
jgi:hypothetical protein